MNGPRKPREGCEWTDERCTQLEKLEWMIRDIRGLNQGSHFIETLTKIIQNAEYLSSWDLNGKTTSFMKFLFDQAIKDRFGDTE